MSKKTWKITAWWLDDPDLGILTSDGLRFIATCPEECADDLTDYHCGCADDCEAAGVGNNGKEGEDLRYVWEGDPPTTEFSAMPYWVENAHLRAVNSAATARIAELEELLGNATEAAEFVAKVREIKRSSSDNRPVIGGVCAYCGEPYTKTGPLKEHVLTCADNPLVKRIAELEAT